MCCVFLKAVSTWQGQMCSSRVLFVMLSIISTTCGRERRLGQVGSDTLSLRSLWLGSGTGRDKEIPKYHWIGHEGLFGLYNAGRRCVSFVCDRLAVFILHISGRGWQLLHKTVREWNPCISGFICAESMRLVWKDGSNCIFCVVKIYVTLKPVSSFPFSTWESHQWLFSQVMLKNRNALRLTVPKG